MIYNPHSLSCTIIIHHYPSFPIMYWPWLPPKFTTNAMWLFLKIEVPLIHPTSIITRKITNQHLGLPILRNPHVSDPRLLRIFPCYNSTGICINCTASTGCIAAAPVPALRRDLGWTVLARLGSTQHNGMIGGRCYNWCLSDGCLMVSIQSMCGIVDGYRT